MGTPVSEGDDITRLSLELEGLRISITRTRGSGRPVSLSSAESLSGFSLVSEATPASPPADHVLGVGSNFTLSHGFPTDTEARIYVAGAGRVYPVPSSR